MRSALLAGFLIGTASAPLAAQGILAGTVLDDATGKPLAGVEVLLEGSSKRALSDNTGHYLLKELPQGTHIALFRFVGYRPIRARLRVTGTDTTKFDASMVRAAPQQLDPVNVAGAVKKPRGLGVEAFEERRKLGFGEFVDAAELRRSEHRKLADVLSSRRVGFTRLYDERGRAEPGYYVVSRRREIDPGTVCPLSVVVDGSPTYTSTGPRGVFKRRTDPASYPFDISLFDVASLEAVELYRSLAEVPNEIGGAGGECGVLVLWASDDP